MRYQEHGKKRRVQLREEAEKLIRESARIPEALPRADVLELIHELEVRQVELELQNEELRRIQSELEGSRQKYLGLLQPGSDRLCASRPKRVYPRGESDGIGVARQGKGASQRPPFCELRRAFLPECFS